MQQNPKTKTEGNFMPHTKPPCLSASISPAVGQSVRLSFLSFPPCRPPPCRPPLPPCLPPSSASPPLSARLPLSVSLCRVPTLIQLQTVTAKEERRPTRPTNPERGRALTMSGGASCPWIHSSAVSDGMLPAVSGYKSS